VTSTVALAGAAPITKVVVVLGTVTHTYDGDLDISLVSPMGTTVDLSSANGAGDNDYVSTIFADAATAPIVGALAPMRGVFRPEGMLSTLNGQSAAGAWTLKVVDHANADAGVLVSWSLGVCR
jgi:subtilisin-like proprotein convertase family protein